MYYYKTGYEIEGIRNAFDMKTFNKSPGYFRPWRAEWSGKTIKLKKFKGDNRAYREYLYQMHHSTQFRPIFNYCKYLNLPKLLIAMEEYYQTQPDYRPPGWSVTAICLVRPAPKESVRATITPSSTPNSMNA